MGDWQFIVPLLRSSLDEWAAFLSKIPEGMALAAILLPVVLAIFSKRLIVVLGCVLLSAIAFCTFAAPSNMPVTLATCIYLGSLIIALSGIVARRTARVREAEFASLREDVKRLRDAEQRRSLRELRSSSTKEPSASVAANHS
jgi:hypothetical protein